MDKKQKSVKRVILTIIFFIILLCIHSKVNATSISISPSEPKVGDTVTVTVSISNVNTADLTAYVSGSASGTVRVVGGDLSGQPSTFSKSENFYCGSEGTLSVSISSDSTAVLNGEYVNVGASASVNVTANNPPSDNNSSNNNDNNSSSNNNSDNHSNNSENNQNTGNPTPATKSSNANLSNLGIRPNDFTGFRPGTTAYNVTVPNDVEQVTVYANLQDSKASLTGTGVQRLNVGENALNIVVTAENGTQKTYTINVTREEEATSETEENTTPEETVEGENTTTSTSDLINLEVTGYELTPKFSPDIYEYTLDVNGDISSLNVVAEGANHNVSVEIVGNTDLVEGENIITILVHNQETDTNSTYQIAVNKTNVDLEGLNTALNDGVNHANRIRYIVLGIILFIVVGVIIFIIVRKKYKENNFSDDIYEYDEEDQERINNERLNLDDEETFFNRVNKKVFEKPEENDAPNELNEVEKQEELQNSLQSEEEEENQEDYFRASDPKRKGKHF